MGEAFRRYQIRGKIVMAAEFYQAERRNKIKFLSTKKKKKRAEDGRFGGMSESEQRHALRRREEEEEEKGRGGI
jgi:hypothetical protein